MHIRKFLCLGILVLVLGHAASVGAVPQSIAQQGRLLNADSTPVTGAHAITFTIWSAATGGTMLWSETVPVTFSNGYYSVSLGAATPLTASMFARGSLFLGIAIDGGSELTPRQPILTVPFALVAERLSGTGEVPIGTVIDWWRPNATFAVPPGYKICDGTTINDPASPYNASTVPNLADRFVMGVTNPASIGTTGGATTHSHSYTPAAHTHGVLLNHDHANVSFSHAHRWASFQPTGLWEDGQGTDVVTWNNGLNEGQNSTAYFPLSFSAKPTATVDLFTSSATQTLDLPAFTGSVTTSSDAPTAQSTAPTSSAPPYVGLLKIMRIK